MDPRPASKKQAIPENVLASQVSIEVNVDSGMLNFLRGEYCRYERPLAAVGYSSQGGHSSLSGDLTLQLHDGRLQARAWLHPQYAEALRTPEILEEINLQLAKYLGEKWSLVTPQDKTQSENLSEAEKLIEELGLPPLFSLARLSQSREPISVQRRLTLSGFEVEEDVARLEIPPAGFLIVEFRSPYVEITTPEILQTEVESFATLVKAVIDGYHKHNNSLPPSEKIVINRDTNTHYSRSDHTASTAAEDASEEQVAFQPAVAPALSMEELFYRQIEAIRALADDPRKRDVAIARIEKLLAELKVFQLEAELCRRDFT
jgi:hypothetical protein